MRWTVACLIEGTSVKQQARSFKHQLLRKWRYSYLAVFIVPLLLFLVLMATSLSIMNKQVIQTNSLSVQVMHNQFERIFSEVNAASQDLLVGSQFQRLSRTSSTQELDSIYLYDSSVALSHVMNKGSAIVDSMIFSPSLNFYVSTTRWGTLEDLPLMDDFSLGWTAEKFASVFGRQRWTLGLEDASCCLAGGGVVNRILVIRPLSFAKSGWHHEFSVAYLVDVSPIVSGYLSNSQDLVITNRLSGTVLYDFTDTYKVGEDAGILNTIPSGQTRRIEGKVVTAGASSETNAMYFVMTEQSSYFHALMVFLLISLGYFVLALGGGWAIVKWRIGKDWQLYEQAMQETGTVVNQASTGSGLYSPFVSSVSRLKAEKEGMSRIISDQTQSLKSNMIAKLLAGSKGTVSKESLQASGIQMVSDTFAVVLLSKENAVPEQLDEQQCIRWFESRGFGVFPSVSTQGIALILNIPIHDQSQDSLRLYIQTMQSMKEEEIFHCLDIASSDLVEGLASLGEAYLQAVNVLEYRYAMGSKEFMMNCDMLEMSSKIHYIYSTEQELRLSQAVQTGNSAEAVHTIHALINDNKALGVSPQRLRYLLFNIAGTIIRCANHLEERYPGMIPTISLPPILQADDLAQSCKVVEAIVSNVCNAVLLIEKQYAGEGGAQYGMYQRALSEVHSDYRNPMLNVALLADRLGISTVLLSRIFKKFHGFNISDYISSVRVEAAKALLREGVLVSEVVEQCGFGSLRTFMRVFKNSEKLTPGQYRSLQGEE